jgi:ribosome-associated translation inhibitor RaiA
MSDFPLEIVIRDIPRTAELEQRVRDKVAKLAVLHDRITRCRVVIASPAQHHHRKSPYQVRIELGVPGPEIVVTKESEQDPAHDDLSIALRDAFDAAKRQIQDRLGRIRNHPAGDKGEAATEPS